MTKEERKMANALRMCSFIPGSFDKKFVGQLANWEDREMTDKGREFLKKLYKKYRRQHREIPI